MTGRSSGRGLALALAAGLFATGVAAGVAVDRLLLDTAEEAPRRGRPRSADEMLERYRVRLDLDEAQARAVGEVLRRRFQEAGEVLRRFEPDLDAIRRRANDDVRAVLRPEQHPRFDEIVREQEERRQTMRRRLGDSHPSEKNSNSD